MKADLKKIEEQHKLDVRKLADHGGYKIVRHAESYCESHLAKVWRPILGIETDDGPLFDQLKFTPTMTLILHLFGKAVHAHGAERSKLPKISAWRPVITQGSERPRFPKAISKNDIAKIVGKSRSAVDDAVGRLRRGRDAAHDLFSCRLAHALFVETGIMLDVTTHANLSFSFMLEDYEYAATVAREAQLRDAETILKQKEWCADATRSKSAIESLSEAAKPVANPENAGGKDTVAV